MHDVAWRGVWICVRSKDAQKQLARTSLKSFKLMQRDDDDYFRSGCRNASHNHQQRSS